MIASIGNPVYDMIKTPYIESEGRVLSGCSTNASIVAAQLTSKALLVGCVGNDLRKKTEEMLSAFGVESILYSSEETGGFDLDYDVSGDRELKVLGKADPIREVPEIVFSADIVLCGPILQEIDTSLVCVLSKRCDFLFCDPQGFLREIENHKITHVFPQALKDVLPKFKIVKPNELEAYTMTGMYASQKPLEVMETLYTYCTSVCIVTLADKGSLIFDGSELIKIPPFRTEAKDPTGAGDSYAAGFMVEYLRSGNLYESGLFASCTASLWVEAIGPYIEISEEKVRERVEHLE